MQRNSTIHEENKISFAKTGNTLNPLASTYWKRHGKHPTDAQRDGASRGQGVGPDGAATTARADTGLEAQPVK